MMPLVEVVWMRGFCASRLHRSVEPLRGRPAMKWMVFFRFWISDCGFRNEVAHAPMRAASAAARLGLDSAVLFAARHMVFMEA